MAKYSYFLGQNGGSGGSGDFALIKIEYPVGQPVTVTFNGDTIEAPDTSGLWMFGCEETGTYTIAITGTTAEVEVEITTQGQIESVWISPQVINYALIYYLGNEFTNVYGTDEAKYAISTGGWVDAGQYKTWLNNLSTYCYLRGLKTNLNINTEGYSKVAMFSNRVSSVVVGKGQSDFQGGTGYISNCNTRSPKLSNGFCWGMEISNSTVKGFQISGVNNFNLSIYVACSGENMNWSTDPSSSISKNSNNLYMAVGSLSRFNIYMLSLIKTDDISGLSDYGNDIATILSNATDLFTDTTALNWMCLNCTGDFMISALSNTNFVNAMNGSPNKSILVANEHWNRFIALLSV